MYLVSYAYNSSLKIRFISSKFFLSIRPQKKTRENIKFTISSKSLVFFLLQLYLKQCFSFCLIEKMYNIKL